MNRAAHVAGCCHFSSEMFLSIHPIFGSWVAFRAVVVVDLAADVLAEAPPPPLPPLLSDAEAEGCDVGMNGGKAYDCLGSNNGVCAAELKLAITRNAYFVEGLAVAAEMFPQPTTGKAVRTITVNFSGTEVEALAAEMFAAQPAADRTLAIPPSIDEVLARTC